GIRDFHVTGVQTCALPISVGLAAMTSGVLGLLVGYVVVRTPVQFVSSALRQITFFPYLVPGIAFAVAYLSLFAVARGPVPALYEIGRASCRETEQRYVAAP